MRRSRTIQWATAFGIFVLMTRGALADGSARVVLGSEVIPEAAVEIALTSCRGEAFSCFEGAWFDGFRLALSARADGLERGVRFARVRRELLLGRLYGALGSSLAPPTEAELQASYEKDKAEFVRPEALRIFRILFDSETAGRAALENLPEVVSLSLWRARARELSVDHATHERGGDLGFVGPEGGTDVPEVRAEPGLYQVAAGLKDGEILRQLVPEGEKFALIWRRGSRAAEEETFEQVRADLALRLDEARRYELLRSLVTALRGKELHEFNPQKLAIYTDTRKSH